MYECVENVTVHYREFKWKSVKYIDEVENKIKTPRTLIFVGVF